MERVVADIAAQHGVAEEGPHRRRLAGDGAAGVPHGVEECEEPPGNASVDIVGRTDPCPGAIVEELGEVPPIGVDGMSRKTALLGEPGEISFDRDGGELRCFRRFHDM